MAAVDFSRFSLANGKFPQILFERTAFSCTFLVAQLTKLCYNISQHPYKQKQRVGSLQSANMLTHRNGTAIGSNLGFSAYSKKTSTCRLEESEDEPLMLS